MTQQYVEQIYIPTPQSALSLLRSLVFDRKSCVSLVKALRPDLDFVWGSPSKVEAYKVKPEPGMAVLTTEGPVGHTAIVESVSSTSMIVLETNYIPNTVATRSLPLDSIVIRGFR